MAAIAFSDSALKPRPGGTISPFCDPHTVTSILPFVVAQIDRRERRDGIDNQQRRMTGAVHRAPQIGDPAHHAGRRLVVDDDDGLQLVGRVVLSRCSSASGDAPRRQVPGTYSTMRPRRSATTRQAMCENQPVSKISMRSPGESVLASAASAAPVPDEGKITVARAEEHTPFTAKYFDPEVRELGTPMIDGGPGNLVQDTIGNVGRTGDLKEVTATIVHGEPHGMKPLFNPKIVCRPAL